jgi:hypothetical protein
MNTDVPMWTEVVFNLACLAAIRDFVGARAARCSRHSPVVRRIAEPLLLALAFLALGDAGHVSFWVWAIVLGDLEAPIIVLGQPLILVGLGAPATVVMVTGFYVLPMVAWQRRLAATLR